MPLNAVWIYKISERSIKYNKGLAFAACLEQGRDKGAIRPLHTDFFMSGCIRLVNFRKKTEMVYSFAAFLM
jgi:hypothetical protein